MTVASDRRHDTRFLRPAIAVVLLTLAGSACDAKPEVTQPAATNEQPANGQGDQDGQSKPTNRKKPNKPPKGRVFSSAAGKITVRRAGFDALRIVEVEPNAGWTRRIDDNFDDSVGVDFFKQGRKLDVEVSIDSGRLRGEACEDLPRLSSQPSVADAGRLSITRVGDEDLHVSVVQTSGGWNARVTDNNSEDIEVLFVSSRGRIDFDAELDDGRLTGTVCRSLN
jgi:hypothetical protein